MIKYEQCSLFPKIRKADPDHAMLIALSPAANQAALTALHAFCIELAKLPNAVNEAMAGQLRLQWWRDCITQLYGDAPDTTLHPILPALSAAIHDFALPQAKLLSMIEARALPLHGWSPHSMTDLTKQNRALYGTEMALWAHILDATTIPVEPQALAFSLIAHIRAAPWDQRDNICHIPQKIMLQFGLDQAQFHSTPPEKLQPVWQAMAQQARNLLSGTQGPTHKTFRAHRKLCLLYLKQLEKCDYNPYAYHPPLFKAWRLLRA